MMTAVVSYGRITRQTKTHYITRRKNYEGKDKILGQLIMIGCILGLCASMAVAEEPYRFVLAYGPWDLAQGRIGVDEQPDDPYFQYVEKTYGVAPLTISWEWEGI